MKPICVNCLQPTEERVDITMQTHTEVFTLTMCPLCFEALHEDVKEFAMRQADMHTIERKDLT